MCRMRVTQLEKWGIIEYLKMFKNIVVNLKRWPGPAGFCSSYPMMQQF